MIRPTGSLLIALLAIACGGDSPDAKPDSGGSSASASAGKGDDFEACALLTAEEIQSAAGWAPDTTDGKTYGSTKVCSYTGPDAMKQSVVLVVARPAPKVATSAELSTRRNEAFAREKSIKMASTPIEGLGMPAVRTEVEGAATPTVEIVVGRHLVGLTAGDFEVAKTLAAKAASRLQ